jgi:FolB domain-containing protein
MDRILIRDLIVRTKVSSGSRRQALKEDFILNLAIGADLRAAGETDNLDASIDYSRLKKRIIAATGGTGFRTIRQLAECVAGIGLEDPKAQCIEVSIDRMSGLQTAASTGVVLTRVRRCREEKRK